MTDHVLLPLTIPHAKTKLQQINNKKLQKGEKVLVLSEQALGDTFQYMRYIPYLKTLGLNVSFSAQTKLHSLIKSSGKVKYLSSILAPVSLGELIDIFYMQTSLQLEGYY